VKKDVRSGKIVWGRLFYNNKFAIAFSVFLSVVLWMVLVSNDTQDRPHAIPNVPIKVVLSDTAQADGMKVFSQTDTSATVYVKGNSLVVNQLKSSDLVAVASLPSNITSAGSYILSLEVQSNSQDVSPGQYTFSSVSPSQIMVSVDKYREKTFKIQSDTSISYKAGYQSDPAYFVGVPTLSSDTVTISGPERQVAQVNRVALSNYEVNDTLRETKKFTSTLVLYDANGNKIDQNGLTVNPEKVDVTIPVMPRQTLTLNTTFTNKPAGLVLASGQIQVSPGSIEVAGPKDILAGMNGKFNMDPIDFSSVSPTHNTFDINITLPTTCKNLSNLPTAKVTLNLGDVVAKQMTASSFTVKNLSADQTAIVQTDRLPVTVVGPADEVEKLTGSNLVGAADMTGKENFTGQTEVPATFTVSNSSSCWVYGSYMVNVSVAKKGG
jgi:hypothetical protein